MGTVIFDFDSTLITTESLEEILEPKWAGDRELEGRIREITNKGMEGRISFQESLRRRLALAAPSRAEVQSFGNGATRLLTSGMAALVTQLSARHVQVHIVSGGLLEAILPAARYLGIPEKRVHAVKLVWQSDGAFAGIDPEDRMSIAKAEGVKTWIDRCPAPGIAVGDGMTDYHLLKEGLVDYFIAFTQNVRRAAVVETGVPEAVDVPCLSEILERLL